MEKSEKFEDIYSSPNNAPWTYPEIPAEFYDLIEKKIITPPGKVLEMGCGEGHISIFLAKLGFDVTAIDRSANAIKFAMQNAAAQNATVDFRTGEFHEIDHYNERFDFIFDWRFLHEICDESLREKYIQSITKLLIPEGIYLSVSFSGDSDFMGYGKLRTSPAGIEIYFSPLTDLKSLVGNYLQVLDSRIIIVPQKPDLKIKSNYILAMKRL